MTRSTPEADAAALPGFDPRRFAEFAGRVGHTAAIGIVYHAHGEDWAELALPYSQALVGVPESGVLASGPIISLMDNACSTAVWIRLGRFRHQATLDLRIDYLRAARQGATIIGHGECYRLARRVAFVRGNAHDGDGDDPVAHVAGTFIFTGD